MTAGRIECSLLTFQLLFASDKDGGPDKTQMESSLMKADMLLTWAKEEPALPLLTGGT